MVGTRGGIQAGRRTGVKPDMTAQTRDLGKDAGKRQGKRGIKHESIHRSGRLIDGLRRVRNLAELFGEGYAWDGNCQCGAGGGATGYWEGGWWFKCGGCGSWVCYHELEGTAHSSEGLWCSQGRARNTSPPSGCPLLTDAPRTGT